MIRDTSAESYRQVIESRYLSERLKNTFDIVFRYGPLTSRQANTYYTITHGKESNLNQFRSYLSQLQGMGVITTGAKVKCPDTGKTVYQFDVTGNLPVKLKKVSKADKKREMLATVDRLDRFGPSASEINSLKSQINNL